MLKYENVCYSATKTDIIKNVTFTLAPGDFTAIIGANGAGKSTLCKLYGLLRPTSGKVTVNGYDTASTKTSFIARFTGFLFQNPDRQICKNSVRDEIAFGLENADVEKEEIARRVAECVERFGFNPDYAPFALSRGERQRLALASLIALKPKLLILDEPTKGLDYEECMFMMNHVKQINEEGTTVMMVSHDMEVVRDFAREVMVFNDGRLLAKDTTDNIMRDEVLLAQASLLPPQITRVALALGKEFEEATTAEGLAEAIAKKKGGAK